MDVDTYAQLAEIQDKLDQILAKLTSMEEAFMEMAEEDDMNDDEPTVATKKHT